MLESARTAIDRQVARVGRRLFFQGLLGELAVGWTVALVLTAGWMLAEPYAVASPASWLRWAVLGGCAAVMTAIAVVQAVRKSPTKTQSALSLDSEFNLRERAVTACSLSAEDAATPAGQALLTDAIAKVKDLKVADKFPIGLPRATSLVPVAAAAVAAVAFFYHPSFPTATATTTEKPLTTENKKDIDKKFEDLAKKPRTPEKPSDRIKSEDLKRLEAKLDDIAKQPRDNAKQMRERIKDISPLEEEVKKLERDRTEKARMLQQQLQSKDGMMPNDVPKDGPAKDLTKALSEGDLEKAKKELDQLAKKLANNEMSEKDKEKLAKQLDDLAKKLDKVAEQKDKENQLKKMAQEGKLDPEALKRELDQLKKDKEKLQDLKKLASKLGQCQKCMQGGDAGQAGRNLGEAADQVGKMDLETAELEDLRDQMQKLKDAKDSLCKACDQCEGQCMGEGECEGDGEGQCRSKPGRKDYGKGAAEGGAGRRGEGEQGKTKSFDARVAGQFNPKGKKVFDGYAPGQAFKKKPGVDLVGEIQQAAQEAPDAIEVQRIPRAAREMAKGYFKNLGGQNETSKEESKKPEEKK